MCNRWCLLMLYTRVNKYLYDTCKYPFYFSFTLFINNSLKPFPTVYIFMFLLNTFANTIATRQCPWFTCVPLHPVISFCVDGFVKCRFKAKKIAAFRMSILSVYMRNTSIWLGIWVIESVTLCSNKVTTCFTLLYKVR